MTSIFNFRTRRVGGIRFFRLGVFCFSFCISRRDFCEEAAQ
jgi:hypothetical protein